MGKYGDKLLCLALMSFALVPTPTVNAFAARGLDQTNNGQSSSNNNHQGFRNNNNRNNAPVTGINGIGSSIQENNQNARGAQAQRPYSSSYSRKYSRQKRHSNLNTGIDIAEQRFRRQAAPTNPPVSWNFHPDSRKPSLSQNALSQHSPVVLSTAPQGDPARGIQQKQSVSWEFRPDTSRSITGVNTANADSPVVIARVQQPGTQTMPPDGMTDSPVLVMKEAPYQINVPDQPMWLSKQQNTIRTGLPAPQRNVISPDLNQGLMNQGTPNIQPSPGMNDPTKKIIESFFPQLQQRPFNQGIPVSNTVPSAQVDVGAPTVSPLVHQMHHDHIEPVPNAGIQPAHGAPVDGTQLHVLGSHSSGFHPQSQIGMEVPAGPMAHNANAKHRNGRHQHRGAMNHMPPSEPAQASIHQQHSGHGAGLQNKRLIAPSNLGPNTTPPYIPTTDSSMHMNMIRVASEKGKLPQPMRRRNLPPTRIRNRAKGDTRRDKRRRKTTRPGRLQKSQEQLGISISPKRLNLPPPVADLFPQNLLPMANTRASSDMGLGQNGVIDTMIGNDFQTQPVSPQLQSQTSFSMMKSIPSQDFPVAKGDVYQQIQGLTIKDLAKSNFTTDQIIKALARNIKSSDKPAQPPSSRNPQPPSSRNQRPMKGTMNGVKPHHGLGSNFIGNEAAVITNNQRSTKSRKGRMRRLNPSSQLGHAHNQNRPTLNQNMPAHNQNKPAHNQNMPAHNQNMPAHSQYMPTHNQNMPAHNQNIPAHNQNMPAHKQMRPTNNQNRPQQNTLALQPQTNNPLDSLNAGPSWDTSREKQRLQQSNRPRQNSQMTNMQQDQTQSEQNSAKRLPMKSIDGVSVERWFFPGMADIFSSLVSTTPAHSANFQHVDQPAQSLFKTQPSHVIRQSTLPTTAPPTTPVDFVPIPSTAPTRPPAQQFEIRPTPPVELLPVAPTVRPQPPIQRRPAVTPTRPSPPIQQRPIAPTAIPVQRRPVAPTARQRPPVQQRPKQQTARPLVQEPPPAPSTRSTVQRRPVLPTARPRPPVRRRPVSPVTRPRPPTPRRPSAPTGRPRPPTRRRPAAALTRKRPVQRLSGPPTARTRLPAKRVRTPNQRMPSRNGRRPSGSGPRSQVVRRRMPSAGRRPGINIDATLDMTNTKKISTTKNESKLKKRKLNITRETIIRNRPIGPPVNSNTNALLSQIVNELKQPTGTPSNQAIETKLGQILDLLKSNGNSQQNTGTTTPPFDILQLMALQQMGDNMQPMAMQQMGVVPSMPALMGGASAMMPVPSVPSPAAKSAGQFNPMANSAGQLDPMAMLMNNMLQGNGSQPSPPAGGNLGMSQMFPGLPGMGALLAGQNSTAMTGQSNFNEPMMQMLMSQFAQSNNDNNNNNGCRCVPKMLGCPNDMIPRRGRVRGKPCKNTETKCCDDN